MYHIGSTLVEVKLEDLRPTQMTMAFKEVDKKRKSWAKLKPAKRRDKMRKELVPAVMGPGQTGVVTLADPKRRSAMAACYSDYRARILGAAREEAPCFEAGGQLHAVERRAQQMAFEREVLADGTEAREKRLRALRPAKSSHAPLAFTGSLMAVLGAVVHARTSLHEHMPPHVRELQDLGLRGRLAVVSQEVVHPR